MNQISLRSFFVLTLLLFTGCGSVEENRERLLEKVIEKNSELKKSVIEENNGVVSDLIVSRDGDEDCVIFELVYAKGCAVDESQLSEESSRSSILQPKPRKFWILGSITRWSTGPIREI